MLGVLMGNLKTKADIRNRLMRYEQLRRPRANKVRDLSAVNLQIFHMLACKDCEEETKIESWREGHANWAEAGFCTWLFGHDIVAVAEAGQYIHRDGMQKSLDS